MREIKFRVWGIDVNGEGEPKMYFSGDIRDTDMSRRVMSQWEDEGLSELNPWTQYTGLKDKNGVEIYEGDILGKRPYGYLKSDGTRDGRYRGKDWNCWAVEWGEYDASEAGLVSGYEYEVDGKYAGWNITVGGYDDDLKDNEVIGNIYDNPELLK